MALPSLSAHAHELWLDSRQFQPPEGENVEIELRNGQNFKGINLSYFKGRIKQFFWVQNEEREDVVSRSGDVPAMSSAIEAEGLVIVVYESTPSTVSYSSWDKFTRFISHKDFPAAEKLHTERGLPQEGFKEQYHRYSKALLARGHAKGSDRNFGLETEFVAQTNPYLDKPEAGFKAQLWYGQKPRENAQVEVFERDPEGAVVTFYLRTDAEGRTTVPIKAGFDYLLDAVVLREAVPETHDGAVWESLWAAMTFSVPAK